MTSSASLYEINQALGEFAPLAAKISSLKKDIIEKEAEILVDILEKITSLVPLLTPSLEFYNRCGLVIQSESREVPLYTGGFFFHESKLVLYENGDLVREFRYGSHANHLSWEDTESMKLTAEGAILLFGLDSIAESLAKVLRDVSMVKILTREMEDLFEVLVKHLMSLRGD